MRKMTHEIIYCSIFHELKTHFDLHKLMVAITLASLLLWPPSGKLSSTAALEMNEHRDLITLFEQCIQIRSQSQHNHLIEKPELFLLSL